MSMQSSRVRAALGLAVIGGFVMFAGADSARAQGGNPNILFIFIMGDDIGFMQPGIYHRGLMVGETPFPPLQSPASYNLTQVMEQVKSQTSSQHVSD